MIRLLDRYSDIALAIAVVAMVGMLIVPLPTALVDVLLTFNIAGAVALLLASTYVQSALRISALPAILLLTTLFRLALNVSTTRLILLQADAGRVIDAFGSFVVRGNYVVGAVIFLILTIIQFVVIAKGSERVAEVAARFTLDAMPGRQMAIDADLRSGAIGLDDAQLRRRALQRESKLYGAMDGAMKFVKGDAIAGIVITTVNIGAGLAIGVWQRGMPLADAAELYALLTIGDGLVSQIPAILFATTAGLVVTRVSSDDDEGHLARDIGSQVLSQPKAIAITAGLLLVFAILPGLPLIPFLLLAVFMALLARSLFAREKRDQGTRPRSLADLTDPPPDARLAIRCGSAIMTHLEAETDQSERNARFDVLRQRIATRHGVEVPRVVWASADPETDPWAFEITIDGVPVRLGTVARDRTPAVVLDDIARVVEAAIEPQLREFVGIQVVQSRLDRLERSQPALVRAVVPKVVSISVLTEILGLLLDEGVPVNDLARILEVIAKAGPAQRDAADLVERVRQGLKRQISHKYVDESGRLPAHLLDRPVEDMIRSALRKTDLGVTFDLDAEVTDEILDAIEASLSEGLQSSRAPILLTRAEIRPHVRRLAEARVPGVTVLSYDELLPNVEIRMVGRVKVGRTISDL